MHTVQMTHHDTPSITVIYAELLMSSMIFIYSFTRNSLFTALQLFTNACHQKLDST